MLFQLLIIIALGSTIKSIVKKIPKTTDGWFGDELIDDSFDSMFDDFED